MKNISNILALGIANNWPTRKQLIEWFGKTSLWSLEKAVSYNSRSDKQNIKSIPPHTAFGPAGARLRFKAQALALQGEQWEPHMRDALAYMMFGDQLNYFWHGQFRKIFPEHPQPLRSMNWELMVETMAMAFVLGRVEEGVYQGYLTYAALNQAYQLQSSYEDRHRCGLAFMLRLFADWRGDVTHAWPAFATSEPIYESILGLWRTIDPEVLSPWLLAACDRHTHESQPDTESIFYDFSSFPRMPLEILLLFSLRKALGLKNSGLRHPLMEAPFDYLPVPQTQYVPDELVLGTLVRVRADWPEFNKSVSFQEIKGN